MTTGPPVSQRAFRIPDVQSTSQADAKPSLSLPAGTGACWYAIRTRARHEKRVHEALVERGVESFLPLWERWSRWKDRKKRVQFPLFPGYAFVRLDLAARLAVLRIPGVVGFVTAAEGPASVPAEEIDAIRTLVSGALHYDPHPFFTEGMEVEVVRGPLRGVRGRLIRKDRSASLVISVTLIRQAAAVEIDAADVTPV
jgi:transcriptional antiterminator NusG